MADQGIEKAPNENFGLERNRMIKTEIIFV